MRPAELILIILCALTLGLQLHDMPTRNNRVVCRPAASRPNANTNTNGRWVF